MLLESKSRSKTEHRREESEKIIASEQISFHFRAITNQNTNILAATTSKEGRINYMLPAWGSSKRSKEKKERQKFHHKREIV